MNVVKTIAVGVLFGFALSRIGFSSWDEVHGMFTFTSLRLLLTFMLAVAVVAPVWIAIQKRSDPGWRPRPIHAGSLIGGLLFGTGWALSGACPSIALVQLGEGQLGALYTLGGIVIGNWVYGEVHTRYLRWDIASCLDE